MRTSIYGKHEYHEGCIVTLTMGRAMDQMDKTIRVYTSLDQMKAEEFRDWQTRSACERMRAVTEITLALYAMKEPAPHVRRLQRTLVHLQRPER